ncbi:hypothetical protein [Myroides sp. N17-2]|uniref:hypothetical protein n=1 Tax=Myroides sp. N17-2 TaxID=2030799 RepID=UPI000EFAE9F5|nr:hypothetical protein [Myroides sp. N17-2]
MGIIVGGVVIDKNYQSDIEGLERILGKKLVYEGDTIFKKASVNEQEADNCEVYFSDRGTLVLTSIERASILHKAIGQEVLSFVIDEESMAFGLNYTRNNFLVRKVLEVEGDIVESKGELLDFEEGEEDKLELIYHVIEELLDEYIWDIEPQEKCISYRLVSLEVDDQDLEMASYVINTVEFDDLEEVSALKDDKQIINTKEEITKVKRSKESILKKVIKGIKLRG